MDRPGKRSVALLLAFSLLLSLLAGCGKKENAQQLSANVYVPRYLTPDMDVDYVRGGCVDEENVYLIGQKELTVEQEDPDTGDKYITYTYDYAIYRVPLDGGAAEKLANYEGPSVPEGRDGSAYIDSIRAASDGTLWVTEYIYVWGSMDKYDWAAATASEAYVRDAAEDAEADPDEPADDEYDGIDGDMYMEDQETILRRQIDSQGNELSCMDLSSINERLEELLDENAYVSSTVFDRDGNLYAVTNSEIFVLNPQMELLFSVEGSDMWYTPIELGSGGMAIQKWEYDEEAMTSTNKLLTIDLSAQDWGPEYILPDGVYTIYPGGGDYLYYYRVNDTIFGWRAGDGEDAGEGERLFAWLEADIDSSTVQDFFFLPDGRVAAITQEWSGDGKGGPTVNVAVMTSTPRSELPEKTTLVLATMYLYYDMRQKVLEFNKTSDKYRIEVKDYSEYNTSDNAGLQKLNTEILAGNIPDILDTNSLPMRQYGARGILEDLWPFIDGDPDLGRDALMIRPLEANEQDGKLYEVFQNFSITTAVGPAGIVGGRTSWTLAELLEALERMPEGCSIFGQSDTKDGMLSTVVSVNMDQFVNWDTGECSFDSDAFKALLSFCNSFPAEFNWEDVDWDSWEDDGARIINGKQMLYQCGLYNFDWYIQSIAAIFNNDYSYIGFPVEDGSCGSAFSIGQGMAMSSACKDKDGAWSFIRQSLLPQTSEGEKYYGNFPINKYDFDKLVEQSITPLYETDENGDPLLDEDGQPILVDMGTMWVTDGLEVPYRSITQEEVDKVMALYNDIDSVSRYDEKIYSAIQEVAGQYFAGDMTLDNAANLIQSKVKLYVNESK